MSLCLHKSRQKECVQCSLAYQRIQGGGIEPVHRHDYRCRQEHQSASVQFSLPRHVRLGYEMGLWECVETGTFWPVVADSTRKRGDCAKPDRHSVRSGPVRSGPVWSGTEQTLTGGLRAHSALLPIVSCGPRLPRRRWDPIIFPTIPSDRPSPCVCMCMCVCPIARPSCVVQASCCALGDQFRPQSHRRPRKASKATGTSSPFLSVHLSRPFVCHFPLNHNHNHNHTHTHTPTDRQTDIGTDGSGERVIERRVVCSGMGQAVDWFTVLLLTGHVFSLTSGAALAMPTRQELGPIEAQDPAGALRSADDAIRSAGSIERKVKQTVKSYLHFMRTRVDWLGHMLRLMRRERNLRKRYLCSSEDCMMRFKYYIVGDRPPPTSGSELDSVEEVADHESLPAAQPSPSSPLSSPSSQSSASASASASAPMRLLRRRRRHSSPEAEEATPLAPSEVAVATAIAMDTVDQTSVLEEGEEEEEVAAGEVIELGVGADGEETLPESEPSESVPEGPNESDEAEADLNSPGFRAAAEDEAEAEAVASAVGLELELEPDGRAEAVDFFAERKTELAASELAVEKNDLTEDDLTRPIELDIEFEDGINLEDGMELESDAWGRLDSDCENTTRKYCLYRAKCSYIRVLQLPACQ
ncbi:unnamed protein product [Protopolystoma xenopodis]|uniref:Uncharacterized protein n=1 Tax=Protopolystoma xenopodis TaxID=117903 RepID=A0A448XMG4_9PLAT|nr:unnamed protein product [Protopolystoma xenopodis]